MNRLLIFFTLLCSALSAVGQDDALRLDVYSTVMHASGPNKEKSFVLTVRSFVTNTGKAPLTIPTSTLGGGWSGLVQNGSSRTVIYSIGFGELGAKKTKVVSSPFRHFPVELQPGEATELPKQEFQMPAADTLKRITVVFGVDTDFAKRFGWWSGTMRALHVVGEGDNPFVEVMRPSTGEFTP